MKDKPKISKTESQGPVDLKLASTNDPYLVRVSLIKDIAVGIFSTWSRCEDADAFYWEEQFGRGWKLYRHDLVDEDVRLVIQPDLAIKLSATAQSVMNTFLNCQHAMSLDEVARIRSRFGICWLNKHSALADQMEGEFLRFLTKNN